MKYDLSILICTLPSRFKNLEALVLELNHQCLNRSVQILYLGDNKSMSVGEKRNRLLSICDGNYVTFIDDDDHPKEDYISEIFNHIDKDYDVITFLVEKYFNGEKDRTQKFSRAYWKNHRSPDKQFNLMLPNHLCVWKKSVIKEKFPDISLGEDWRWAELMTQHYSNECNIDKVLYIYDFWKDKTETQ